MKINLNKTQLSFILVIIMLLALPVGLYLGRQTQNTKSSAFEKGTVGLQLSPASLDSGLAIGQPLDVSLQVNVGDVNKITGVDIKVRYSDELVPNSFEPDTSSGLDKLVEGYFDPTQKLYHYIAVTSAQNLTNAGIVNLGKLKFTTAKPGTATITISDQPIITAAGQKNMLTVQKLGSSGAVYVQGQYTIGSISTSPSPSVSVSVSPPPAAQCIDGDADGNGCVDNADFVEWFKEFTGISSDKNSRGELKADFYPTCQNNHRGDGSINGADLNVWINAMSGPNKCK